VLVLVGAGISTSLGIPDFRSKDCGLYNHLDTASLGLSCPEELFCTSFFEEDPGPFYKFARNLYFPLGMDKRVKPSDSHKLLALLEEKKMLLRVYTQNIDGLEAAAGVSDQKTVYVHGSLGWARCTTCGKRVQSDEIMPAIQNGVVPKCKALKKKRSSSTASVSSAAAASGSNGSVSSVGTPGSSRGGSSPEWREPNHARVAKKRPRSVTSLFTLAEDESTHAALDSTTIDPTLFCGGVLKPGITFFGETLNDNVRRKIESDRKKADALIVIGTSLSVAPISKVIEYLPSDIPRILINRTVVHPSRSLSTTTTAPGDEDDEEEDSAPEFRDGYVFDAYMLGYCDDVTRNLARKLFRASVYGNDATMAFKQETNKKRRKISDNSKGTIIHSCGALLTNVLEGKEKNWNAQDWSCVDVPSERVLLFPGATASKDDTSSAQVDYREVAHCDGCTKRIQGVIKKCVVCFDYDLCAKCFPALSKSHFDGKHHFQSETSLV
jgi:NAD-dependent SIR2 family protein deacetylase